MAVASASSILCSATSPARYPALTRRAASWRAGVVRYDVDFAARTVAYYGSEDEEYVEAYPAVDLKSAPGA